MSLFEPSEPIGRFTHQINESLVEYRGANSKDPQSPQLPRKIYFLVVTIAFFIFGSTLLRLQVEEGAKHQVMAEGNRIRARLVPAPRGIIYDRNGKQLVTNKAGYKIEIIPADLPREKSKQEEVYTKIVSLLQITRESFISEISNKGLYSVDPVVLVDNIPPDQALKYQVELLGLTGVRVNSTPIRNYELIPGISHILGYIGKVDPGQYQANSGLKIDSEVGKLGIEKIYDKYIRGLDGQERVEVDATGKLERVIATINPVQGGNVKLSVDAGLQQVAGDALAQSITENGSKAGVAIASDPRDGSILAIVSLPDFSGNDFSQRNNSKIQEYFNDENRPLVNRAISGVYPPGSSIKPVIASIALNNKIVSPSFSVDTPSEIRIGDFVFPDWKDHGKTDIKRALAESNNIFFYALGGGWDKIRGLGIDRLTEGLRWFGINKTTGIDLTGEKSGTIPDPAWKRQVKKEPWYIGDTYHLSIGQGDLTVTPLEMLSALSMIATGGNSFTPHLVTEIDDEQGNKIYSPEARPMSVPIAKEDLNVVKDGMKQAVEYGSARSIAPIKNKDGSEVVLAAKTGTAQFGNEDKTHAWFIAFAPADNPEFAVTVLVEGGGEGYKSALPVAKKMFEYWFSLR